MYGKNPPPFHADPNDLRIVSVQQVHQYETAVRALMHELTAQLRQSNCYEGSKLALMHHYNVKVSSLASGPIFVDVKVPKQLKKARRAKPAARVTTCTTNVPFSVVHNTDGDHDDFLPGPKSQNPLRPPSQRTKKRPKHDLEEGF